MNGRDRIPATTGKGMVGGSEMIEKNCDTCNHQYHCGDIICNLNFSSWAPRTLQAGIVFPILNNLTPTIESCTMKLIEELGELLQIIGKCNQMSGELPRLKTGERNPLRLIEESFDVAQSAVTMIHTIADKYDIDIIEQQALHEEKLRQRGYLK